MNTQQFPLRTVLTVTTGRLLTKPKGPHDNGIGDLYEILNWITGDGLFTQQLPRAGNAARPWLLKCFPELAPVSESINRLDSLLKAEREGGSEGVVTWLAEMQGIFPELKDNYDIEPMPGGWTTIDPVIELESMVGKEKVLKIEI